MQIQFYWICHQFFFFVFVIFDQLFDIISSNSNNNNINNLPWMDTHTKWQAYYGHLKWALAVDILSNTRTVKLKCANMSCRDRLNCQLVAFFFFSISTYSWSGSVLFLYIGFREAKKKVFHYSFLTFQVFAILSNR